MIETVKAFGLEFDLFRCDSCKHIDLMFNISKLLYPSHCPNCGELIDDIEYLSKDEFKKKEG